MNKEELNKKSKKVAGSIKKGLQLGGGIANGIIGNHLESIHQDLSIQMNFYSNGKKLLLNKENLQNTHPNLSSKICILIHGLTNLESIWDFPHKTHKNYGTLLQIEAGYSPFYIRYNTGLHISENGKQLTNLIDKLTANYPIKIEEIIIIAHSMGGLVTRSACYYAQKLNHSWINNLKKIFFLGTPHLGAPLERFGNILTSILKNIPNIYTRWTGEIIDLRSDGIKDLRYGYLIDEDWKNNPTDELLKNNKTIVPLIEYVEYYIITGTISKQSNNLINDWFGDALVTKNSGIGNSKSKHHIAFNLENHKEFLGKSHLSLAYSEEIYSQIKSWI